MGPWTDPALMLAYDEGVDAALTLSHEGVDSINPYEYLTPCWHAWQEGYNS